MKYLKTYEAQHVRTIANKMFKKEYDKINTKLFEVEEYINDILINLVDEGYDVKTSVCTDIADNHINLRISRLKPFILDDIEYDLLHLDNYLKSESFKSFILAYLKYENRSSVKRYDDRDIGVRYSFYCCFYPEKVYELRAKNNKK